MNPWEVKNIVKKQLSVEFRELQKFCEEQMKSFLETYGVEKSEMIFVFLEAFRQHLADRRRVL